MLPDAVRREFGFGLWPVCLLLLFVYNFSVLLEGALGPGQTDGETPHSIAEVALAAVVVDVAVAGETCLSLLRFLSCGSK